jgi:hypothetical protein
LAGFATLVVASSKFPTCAGVSTLVEEFTPYREEEEEEIHLYLHS